MDFVLCKFCQGIMEIHGTWLPVSLGRPDSSPAGSSPNASSSGMELIFRKLSFPSMNLIPVSHQLRRQIFLLQEERLWTLRGTSISRHPILEVSIRRHGDRLFLEVSRRFDLDFSVSPPPLSLRLPIHLLLDLTEAELSEYSRASSSFPLSSAPQFPP